MARSLYYQVNEISAETGKFFSQIQSADPFIAICDFMVKAHCPLNYPAMRDSPSDPIKFTTYPILPDFAIPGPVNMGWTGVIRETETPYLITTINTIEVMDFEIDETDFVHPASIDKYRNENYIKALSKIRERLLRWTDGNIEITLILAACSILDSAHPFWYENRPVHANGLRY